MWIERKMQRINERYFFIVKWAIWRVFYELCKFMMYWMRELKLHDIELNFIHSLGILCLKFGSLEGATRNFETFTTNIDDNPASNEEVSKRGSAGILFNKNAIFSRQHVFWMYCITHEFSSKHVTYTHVSFMLNLRCRHFCAHSWNIWYAVETRAASVWYINLNNFMGLVTQLFLVVIWKMDLLFCMNELLIEHERILVWVQQEAIITSKLRIKVVVEKVGVDDEQMFSYAAYI